MYYEMRADGSRIPLYEGGLAQKTTLLDDDITLTIIQSGGVFEMGTDAKVITLPAVKKGAYFTFRNVGADGNNTITLSPNSDDGIFGSIANAAADSVAGGVNDKDLVNTKSTANKGDWVRIEADDSETGWFITGGVGIWASEG